MHKKRFWEIDLFRGIAIILMMVFHLAFDLDYFHVVEINMESYGWDALRVVIFSLFFVLVGISMTISYNRKKGFYRFLKKGGKVFLMGMIITVITYFFVPTAYVRFGVLHFIGLSIILAYPLLNLKLLNIVFVGISILLGAFFSNILIESPWLLWLGIKPVSFSSLDYYPLFPYFGIILTGIIIGNYLYEGGNRKFRFKDSHNFKLGRFIEFMGRNSLIIYMLHQPLIVLVLFTLINFQSMV